MKLTTQLSEMMRDTSNIWAPPIYRRLVSIDKREKDMAERCLLKIWSTVCPPPLPLSKVLELHHLLQIISLPTLSKPFLNANLDMKR